MALAYAQPAPTRSRPAQLPQLGPDQLPAAVVFATSPFGSFRRENGTGIHLPQHDVSSNLARILEAWENVRKMYLERVEQGPLEYHWYAQVSSTIGNIRCTAKDLESFIAILPSFLEDPEFRINAGLFISALINLGSDQRYVLHLEHISLPPQFIGIFNRKEIEVWGDVGESAGDSMQEGKLTIRGNAREHLGEMMIGGTLEITGNAEDEAGDRMRGGLLMIGGSAKGWVGTHMGGGEIIVKGDAGELVGLHMSGGKITVCGDVTTGLGFNMEGGVIHVDGNCRSIDDGVCGGQIFVGGVQVYPAPVQESVSGTSLEVV